MFFTKFGGAVAKTFSHIPVKTFLQSVERLQSYLISREKFEKSK